MAPKAPNKLRKKLQRKEQEIVEAPHSVASKAPNGNPLCSVPKGKTFFQCENVQDHPTGVVMCSNREILDMEETVKVICSNPTCPTSLFMHTNCFTKFEDVTCMKLSKHARCRGWSDRQVHISLIASLKTLY